MIRSVVLVLTALVFLHAPPSASGEASPKIVASAPCCPASRPRDGCCPTTQPAEGKYLQAVRQFADNVLKYGKDDYGPKHTPLFIDGVNVDTHEPAMWQREANEPQWIMCNLASQHNLFRTLVGVSAMTGDGRYRQAAAEALGYGLANLQAPNGLMYWGGHKMYDANSDTVVPVDKASHELKCNYLYYEFMWQVNPEATRRFIEAFWSAQVLDWSNLDFTRHGKYAAPTSQPWDNVYRGGPAPFDGNGLTFMNAGSDLFLSAAMLSKLSGDPRPLVWAKRLAKRYVEARGSAGLSAANFSSPSSHRMEKQFPQFNGRLTEATITDLYGDRYGPDVVCELVMAQTLGPDGKEFAQWALEDLTAYARHAWDDEKKLFFATLTDGTRLSPEDVKIEGYVKPHGFGTRGCNHRALYSYSVAYEVTHDRLMWDMAGKMAAGLGFGDMGAPDGTGRKLNLDTTANDDRTILSMLALYQATGDEVFLKLAQKAGDNALATRVVNGFFLVGKDYLYSKFDDTLPLALLYLQAAVDHSNVALPVYYGGAGFFDIRYMGTRTRDGVIWGQKRK